jgi:hypothetical protein
MTKKIRVKRPLRQRLLLVGAALALLLVALYFALTSTAFVRRFVLPPLGELIGAEITVADTVIRPFSRFELRDLRVQTGQHEPVLEIAELRVSYDGWALLRGRLVVHECALVAPRVQWVRDASGRSNLPRRFTERSPQPAQPYQGKPASGGALQVALRNLSLTNGLVQIVERGATGEIRSTTVSNLSLALDRFENGAPGRLTLGAGVRCERGAAAGASNDFFTAQAGGAFSFEATDTLALGRLAGGARFDVSETGGSLRDLAALQARLDLLLEANRLSQFDLVFEQRGARVGGVQATGTFDLTKSEGQLRVTLDSINRQVLNIFAARAGVEFAPSAIGGSIVVSLAQGGRMVTAEGQLVGRQLSVRRAGLATPPVDGDATFDVRADRATQRLTLQKFQLAARQGAAELLTGRLDYPMELSWATNAASSFTKSTLSVAVRQFDLGAWRALHGNTNLAGRCDAQLSLAAAPGDKRLQFTATATAHDLAAGAFHQRQLALALQAVHAVTNGADAFTGTASLQTAAAASGDTLPAKFRADAGFDLARKDGAVKLQPSTLRASLDGEPGGVIELAGDYSSTSSTGELRLKITAVNERLLGPFLNAALAPRALASAALDGSALLKLTTGGQATADADFAFSRFTLSAPGAATGTPLAAALKLSTTSSNGVHQFRQLTLNLAPGASPANELEVNGTLDMRGAAAEPSKLSLKAAFLDVTRWWDALAPAGTSAQNSDGGSRAPAPSPATRGDPAPLQLPVKQLAVDAGIARLVARQMELSNVVFGARLNDGLLAVKPFAATLNGAPVSGLIDANLGVPGWLYNVDLKLDRVPLRPVAASFAPGTAGTLGGELTLNGEFKGAGLTYETLRHKLNGTARFALTNAAIEFAPGWKQGVLVTVATLLRAPEIAGGPIAWAAGGATVGGGQLDLQSMSIGTEALIAGLAGRVPLAEAFTNSTLDLPVTLQLRRSLAAKAKLATAGPPDAVFVPLPDFLRVKGTLGRPRSDINQLALGGVLLESLSNVPGLGDDKTRSILQGIGGLLGTPKTPATNAPASANPGAAPRP